MAVPADADKKMAWKATGVHAGKWTGFPLLKRLERFFQRDAKPGGEEKVFGCNSPQAVFAFPYGKGFRCTYAWYVPIPNTVHAALLGEMKVFNTFARRSSTKKEKKMRDFFGRAPESCCIAKTLPTAAACRLHA
jgi:hypothetical protein